MKSIIKIALFAIIALTIVSCSAAKSTGYNKGSKRSCGCKGMVGY